MRLETIVLIIGGLVGLLGLLLLFDAALPEPAVDERRQHRRVERDRWGESLVGLAVLAMSAAMIARDAWAWSTVAVIAGTVMLLWGAGRNGRYIREVFARSQQPR